MAPLKRGGRKAAAGSDLFLWVVRIGMEKETAIKNAASSKKIKGKALDSISIEDSKKDEHI